jgi:hypothetical protein
MINHPTTDPTPITLGTITAEYAALYLQSLISNVNINDPNYNDECKNIIHNFYSGIPPKIVIIISDAYNVNVGMSAAIRKLIVKQVQEDGGWKQSNIDSILSTIYKGTSDASTAKSTFDSTKTAVEYIYGMYRAAILFKNSNTPGKTIFSYFTTGDTTLDPNIGNTAPEVDEFFDAFEKSAAEVYAETITEFIGEDISELSASAIESVAVSLDEAAAAEGGTNFLLDASSMLLNFAVGIDIIGSFIRKELKYCPCDAPLLVDTALPVCYKGTCFEEFGGNYVPTTQGLCALDCNKKYGSCYYNNGSWCANRGIARCWSQSAGYPNDTKSQYSEPAQLSQSTCKWDASNLSNSCKFGYSSVCKDLRSLVPLNDIYQVLKQENLIKC